MPGKESPKVIVDPEYLRDAAEASREREAREGLPDDLRRRLNEAAIRGGTDQSAAFREIADSNRDAFEGFMHMNGYDWLIADEAANEKISEGRAAGAKARQAALDSYNSFMPADKDRSKLEAERIMAERNEEIMSEYKVHLQPVRERLGDVVSRLIGMYKGPDGPRLRQLTGAFKVHSRPARPGEKEIFPEIVVYVMPGTGKDASGKTAGRRNLEEVLAAIVDATRDLAGAAQPKNMAPRYNAAVNDLVYCAQSGGDLKSALRLAGLLDKFFDPKNNDAFRRGETAPSEAELAPRPER